jgi:predicted ATP-dependent protease
MLPATNVQNLTLRDDIQDAVRDGRFHIYAATSVDEALELLTGQPPGSPCDQGTLHHLVAAQLAAYSALMKAEKPAAETK